MSLIVTPVNAPSILKRSDSFNKVPSAKRVSFNLPERIEWTLNNRAKLIDSISKGNVSSQELSQWMIDCKNNVDQLTKEHQPLVRALVGSVWPCPDVDIIPTYMDFLANVVSQHGYLAADIFTTLVKQFAYAPGDLSPNDCNKSWAGEEDLFEIVNSLLDAVMSFSPEFSHNLFWDSLVKCFPYVLKDPNSQASYARHLLRLCRFYPEERTGLLDLLLKQMVALDLAVEGVRSRVRATSAGDVEMTAASEGPVITEKDAPRSNQELALDAMMLNFIDYLEESCLNSERKLDKEAAGPVIADVLTMFVRNVLPSRGTAHVHFVILVLASFGQSALERVLDELWNQFGQPSLGSGIRRRTVGYLASLLCRGAFVPLQTIRSGLQELTEWAHAYMSQVDEEHSVGDIEFHGPFYAVCQAIFYIVSFSHADLTSGGPKALQFLQSLQFSRIINSSLNPLRHCHKGTVLHFANMSRSSQLVYCYTVIERNNRLAMFSSADQTLPPFFPFDDYSLPHSGRKIKAVRKEFVEVPTPPTVSLQEPTSDVECEAWISVPDGTKGRRSKTVSECSEKMEEEPWNYGTSPGFTSFLLKDPDLWGPD